MPLHILRVKVRGRFGALDDELAAALRAEARSAPLPGFSEEGTFSFEPALTFFTFRYQLRARAGSEDEAREQVEAEALRRATAVLEQRGIPVRDVTTSAWDLAEVWR